MRLFSLLLLVVTALSAAAQSGALPRRGSAGLGVVTEENRVVVRDVFPGTAAESAGLQKGDVILSIDKAPVRTAAEFTGPLSRRKAGEQVTVEYQRGEVAKSVTFALKAWPYETSDVYDVAYGEVSDDGTRFRTIRTRPKNAAPIGMLLFVQGLGCGSVDNLPPSHSYRPLIESLTRAGFATLRVEKPGAGDSEGGPCPAVDFHGEVRAFRAALASLKNERNVFLFGHSMGGIQAPSIAAGFPLRGVIVYGTTFNSWAHYIVGNQRRQMRLRGAPFEEISEQEKDAERFNALFYVQKQPLEKILADHPEYREAFPDGKTYAGGKEGKFFQQLYDLELAKLWKGINAPVLSLYGGSDFLTDAAEHESLAAAVNSWRPGTARFVKLDGVDHWIRKAADQKASMTQGPGGSEYDDRFGDTLIAFMKEQIK